MNLKNLWFFLGFACCNLVESHVAALNNGIESQEVNKQSNTDQISQKPRPPMFKQTWDDPQPQEVLTWAAKSFQLDCSVSGAPKPRITWFKNGEEISESDKSYDFRKRKQFLSVYDAFPQHNGNYTCIAKNRFATIQRLFIVEVQPRTVAQKPVIVPGDPGNHTILIGSILDLRCRIANEDPQAPSEIKWIRLPQKYLSEAEENKLQEGETKFFYKGGTPKFIIIQDCGSNGNCRDPSGTDYFVDNPQQLLFGNVTEDDEGLYCCMPKNGFGNAMECGLVDVVNEFPSTQLDNYNAKIIIASSTVIGLILILAIIMILYYALNQKKKRKQTDRLARDVVIWAKRVTVSSQDQRYDNSNGSFELQEPKVTIDRYRVNYSGNSSYPDYSEYVYDCDPPWEFERNNLKFLDTLGEGAFGLVKKAEIKMTNGRLSYVAVKMLKEGHTDTDVIDLVKEMTIMKRIRPHENIITLYGVCTQPRGYPLLVIVEYAKFGDLRNYLLERKSAIPCVNCAQDYMEPDDISEKLINQKCDIFCILSMEDKLKIGWQVAKGMEFLHLSKCIHRDLAARNVLVFENNKVKISDFGFARCIEETDYYRKISEGKLPVKWMAPEAIFDRKFTTQSDIWSFGVLLWEIITMGESPFKNIPVNIYLENLRDGVYLEQPMNCPNDIYAIMEQCWRFNPNDRPNWAVLVHHIQTLVANAKPYKYTTII